jgi:hypothetical protein
VPIPALNQEGLLPEGIYECTVEEVEARFGRFQQSDRRPILWGKFKEFLREVTSSGVVIQMIINGSFLTASPSPNDIDIVLILSGQHDFAADLSPSEYNILSKRRVRRRFGFDIVLARAGTEEVVALVDFFQQVKHQPHLRKGILRIQL